MYELVEEEEETDPSFPSFFEHEIGLVKTKKYL